MPVTNAQDMAKAGSLINSDGTTVSVAADLLIADKLVHTGDTNTAIRFPAADTFTVETNGSERVRVDSSGNVLVGTTSASVGASGRGLLEVNGSTDSLIALKRGNTAGLYLYTSSGEGRVGQTENLPLTFYTNNTERLRIDSSGNVGIGTTSPSTKLDVNGNVNFASTAYLSWGGLANLNAIQGDFPSNTLRFFTANSERLRIDSSGNVGIGVTSPLTALHIKNNGVLQINNPDGTRNLQIFNNSQFAEIKSSVDPIRLNTTEDIRFLTGSTPTERLRITSGGDVCVGTTTSIGKLSVEQTGSIGTLCALLSKVSGDVGQRGLLVSKYDNNATTSQVFIQFGINNGNTNSGQINANGASQAAFGSFSDQRLKENIENLPSQWAKLKALRPVEFDYIESEGGGHQIGFVAQEVLEIYPDTVGERSDGMLTISGMGKNEARLIKALQEAMERIEQLESKVAALEAA